MMISTVKLGPLMGDVPKSPLLPATGPGQDATAIPRHELHRAQATEDLHTDYASHRPTKSIDTTRKRTGSRITSCLSEVRLKIKGWSVSLNRQASPRGTKTLKRAGNRQKNE